MSIDLGLGRIPSEPDPQDHEHLLSAHLEEMGIGPVVPQLRLWDIPYVYDQGQTPRCTAFSAAGFLTAQSAAASPGTVDIFDPDPIYAWAQAHDGIAGPHDGSTVRAAFEAVRQVGTDVTSSNRSDLSHLYDISGYSWASPVDDEDPHLEVITTWISEVGPLWVGTTWYESMFQPDSGGLVSVGGPEAGGHAYLFRGFDPATGLFVIRSSWGADFGGTAEITASDTIRIDMTEPASDALIHISDVAELLSIGGECGTCVSNQLVRAR